MSATVSLSDSCISVLSARTNVCQVSMKAVPVDVFQVLKRMVLSVLVASIVEDLADQENSEARTARVRRKVASVDSGSRL